MPGPSPTPWPAAVRGCWPSSAKAAAELDGPPGADVDVVAGQRHVTVKNTRMPDANSEAAMLQRRRSQKPATALSNATNRW